jgi:hypothetical protein
MEGSGGTGQDGEERRGEGSMEGAERVTIGICLCRSR